MTKPNIDTAPIYLTRTINGLGPEAAIDYETLDAIPIGSRVVCKRLKVQRSPSHLRLLRKYWVGLGRIVETCNSGYPNTNKLHTAIKFALGFHVEFIDLKTGRINYQ